MPELLGNNLVRWAAVEAVQRVHIGPLTGVRADFAPRSLSGVRAESRTRTNGRPIAQWAWLHAGRCDDLGTGGR